MTRRVISTNARIVEEVSRMRVGDTYNVWTDNGKYITPGTVVFANDSLAAIGKEKANWPMLVLEVVDSGSMVQSYMPNSEDGDFESQGFVEELQKESDGFSSDDFPATQTVQEWLQSGVLPVNK